MISASIVTYFNNRLEVKKILQSLLDNMVDIIYIIDNSPFDNLREFVNLSSNIVYIQGQGNIGFGAAHNIAIQEAININSNYHVVINPDIYFYSKIIPRMLAYMDENPDIGLLMPEILYPNGKVQYLPKLLPTSLQLLKRKLSFSGKFFQNSNKWYEMNFVPRNLIYNSPIISGCFSLFRTEALKKVGVYDERFFMYFEDFDLSRRIHKYYRTVYFPEVSVYHEYERGAQKNPRLFKIFIESGIKYFNKWGWIHDSERSEINRKVKEEINQVLL